MRVLVNALFTVPNVQFGAVQTVTEALLSHLVKAANDLGAELFILVSCTNAMYWQQILPNGNFVVLPFPTHNRFVRVAIEQVACHWAVQRIHADVFYSSSGALPSVPLLCKTVVYLQNLLFFHLDEFYSRRTLNLSWLEWFLCYRAWGFYSRWACINSLKRATEVIAVSKVMALEAEKHAGVVRQHPIHVVPYGVNAAFCPDTMVRLVQRPYILSVSSIVPHKNYEACLKIFASLKHRYEVPHDLYILGSGPDKYVASLKYLAAELQIGGSVKFMGHVPHKSLPGWYAHADAFMLTSACESFGLPVIEAMAHGTPVLISNLSGLPETAGNAGIVEDPARTETFADQLHRVLTDEELRQRLRQRGLERAAEFSWERTARATMNVMQKALDL